MAHRHLSGKVVSTLVVLGLLLSGCGTSVENSQHLVAATGGTATVATVSESADCWPLRPASLNAMSSLVQSAVLPSAFVLNEQGVWSLNRSLFSQVELSSTDPQIVIYTLNPAAVWANGNQISSADLIANWQAGKVANLPTALGYQAIESLVPSGHPGLVVAKFSQPYSDWRTLFADLLPASVLAKGPRGCTLPTASIDVSGGPFVVAAASTDEVRLERNPHWWGTPVALDRLMIRRAPTVTTAIEWVTHDRAQVATVGSFSTQDVLRASQSPRTTVSVGQSAAMVQLVPSVRRGVLAQLPLRQLVAAAVDRTSLGQAIVGQSTTNVGTLASVLFAGVSANEQGFDTDPATRPTPVKPLNLEIAAAVGAIGYSFHRGRWVNAHEQPLTIHLGFDASMPYGRTFALTLFSQLKAAGIASVFHEEDGVNGSARALLAGKIDAALVVRLAPQAPSQETPWFVLPEGSSATLANPGGYGNASVSALFLQASGQLNPVDAADAYGAIDTQVAADTASIPLVSLPSLQVWRTRLHGITVFPYGGSVTQSADHWAILVPQPSGRSGSPRVASTKTAN